MRVKGTRFVVSAWVQRIPTQVVGYPRGHPPTNQAWEGKMPTVLYVWKKSRSSWTSDAMPICRGSLASHGLGSSNLARFSSTSFLHASNHECSAACCNNNCANGEPQSVPLSDSHALTRWSARDACARHWPPDSVTILDCWYCVSLESMGRISSCVLRLSPGAGF